MADAVTPIRPTRRRDAQANYEAILKAARNIPNIDVLPLPIGVLPPPW